LSKFGMILCPLSHAVGVPLSNRVVDFFLAEWSPEKRQSVLLELRLANLHVLCWSSSRATNARSFAEVRANCAPATPAVNARNLLRSMTILALGW
jgi:hypothetical protein